MNPAGTGWEATIEITVTDDIPAPHSGGPWTLEIPVRADFDIHDSASPGMDDAYIYTPNPAPPPPGFWTGPQAVEVTHAPVPPPARVVDPAYGMEVLQCDTNNLPNFVDPGLIGGGPWGGITPHSTVAGTPAGANPDIFHLVLYKPGIWEYSGLPVPPGPGGYVDVPPESIAAADVVIWDETSVLITQPLGGGSGSGTINLRLWLY